MENNKYNPEDSFKINGCEIGLTVFDFWKYAYSDLNADPRDVIAEFLVSNALGIHEATNRQDWTLYDIDFRGVRIEVKCTGFYQTWREDDNVSEERRFSIRQATDRKTKICERHNDIYVFCLLKGNTRQEANPLVLENWEFYVIPTSKINEECGNNKSISLNKVKKLCNPSSYSDLKNEIMEHAGIIAMKHAIKELSKTQIKFVCDECVIDTVTLKNMNEQQVYDIVYETMCNIEIEEVCANTDGNDTVRCAIASDIVTILGNAMARAEGFYEEQ